jgi:hypothetical protein
MPHSSTHSGTGGSRISTSASRIKMQSKSITSQPCRATGSSSKRTILPCGGGWRQAVSTRIVRRFSRVRSWARRLSKSTATKITPLVTSG